ncbi:MAG: trypsin-like peptidase domain-containing protein [Gemmataceae bacterium]
MFKHLPVILVLGAACCCTSLAEAQYLRKNAIVEAVNKTKDGIVTLKVTRDSGYGKREIVGTGVIIDERGFMITNYHVINDATRIMATLADKTRVEATIHASLPKHDLAILRLPISKKVKALPLASGSDLMVGETVIAVGNPYGFTNTVSTGIVSALEREIPGPTGDSLTGLIQHSASINPGNSGGPLLNVNGELIGINVALREGAQNICFAINAETVKDVLARQLSASRVSRVVHGLVCDEEVASEGADRQKVVLKKVASSAETVQSGLKQGDIILQVGNLKTQNRFDVERAFWGYKAGDQVTAQVIRAGKSEIISIKLRSADETRMASH